MKIAGKEFSLMNDDKPELDANQEKSIIELDVKPEARTLAEKLRRKLEQMRKEDPNIYPLY